MFSFRNILRRERGLTNNMFNHRWAMIGGATAAFLAVVYVFWGPPKKRQRKGFPGLHNFGNSCFLNVILQSWAACPSLLRWLNSQCTPQHVSSGSLIAAVLKVLKVLNNASEESSVDTYSPDPVLTAMERKGWVISPGQQDCHELMHAMLETLDEETSRAPRVISLFDVRALQDSKNGYQLPSSAITRSCGMLPMLPGRKESPLNGLLASQAVCLTCGYRCPVKYDMFDSLSLSFPQYAGYEAVSVETLLQKYVRPELLEGATCPSCAKKRGTEKGTATQSAIQRTLTIGKLPQTLCLHVQRLQLYPVGLLVKRQDHVTFPETLIMDSYLYNKAGSHALRKQGLCGGKMSLNSMMGSSAPVNLLRALNYDASRAGNGLFLRPPSPLVIPGPLAGMSHNNPCSVTDVNHNGPAFFTSKIGGSYIYRLTSVVSHLGDGTSGHFVTYRRGPMEMKSEQEQRLSDSWWLTSDCTVERTSLDTVLDCQAYMLFYERV